ncbi:MAG TPA: YqgE/AlgH family protein [Arachidicoccus sp.]
MNIKAGTFLISTPLLIQDESFEKAVIYITQYNQNGTTGFVINKLFPQKLNDLNEFKNAPPFYLYNGGPVETDKLYFLHQQPDSIEGGTQVSNTVYLGGDFKQAVDGIANGTLSQNDIKLFIGYCGWDYGQLEAEITEGYWLPTDAKASQAIFTTEAAISWEEMFAMWAN